MIKKYACLAFAALILGIPAMAQSPDELNDLEMAHVAVTASNIDIAYAHLALAFSSDPDVRQFAETMIQDHTAVNQAVADLANKLGVTAQDNAMSKSLLEGADKFMSELVMLRGDAFNKKYIKNELAYHETVNGVVKGSFIPNIENPEVKAAFETALNIFKGHEKHASKLVAKVGSMNSSK